MCIIQLKDRSWKGPSGVGCKTNLFVLRWDPSAEWKLREAEKRGVVGYSRNDVHTNRKRPGENCLCLAHWTKVRPANSPNAKMEYPK